MGRSSYASSTPGCRRNNVVRDSLFQRLLWTLPLLISAGIAGAIQRGVLEARLGTIGAIVAVLCLVGVRRLLTLKSAAEDPRPTGILVFCAGSATVLASTLFVGGVSLLVVIAGLAICGFGLSMLMAHRLGQRPGITEREMAIVAAGCALVAHVFAVVPRFDMSSGWFQLGVSMAVAGATFGVAYLLWMLGHDPSTLSMPAILLLSAQCCLAAHVAFLIVPLEWMSISFFPLVASGLAAAAFMHSEVRDRFAPAVIKASEVNVRRSLLSFSVVLIGPILVGVDMLTSNSLSLPAITIGSSLLSLLVAGHLLQLVRHWGAVEHQGQHDPLTSLPNRPLFFSRLESAIDSARLREVTFSTMFIDLDRFKAVNDTLGHDKGDELLRQVAGRLDSAAKRVSSDVTVARLGGDEFAILVPQVNDDRHAHAIGRLFLDQFLDPFDVGLRDIYVTPSIGIAQYPRDGENVDQLIENADTAMFEAKDRGRNMVVAYSPEQRIPGAHRLEIEAALHRAIDNNEMQLLYQPQVDITTGEIFAVEALLRWIHPTLGQISPEKFVPVAEESALIDTIGRWTLEQACLEAARWKSEGLPPINVAVNLSARQFQKATHLTEDVARALRTSGLEPERLELELTESLALEKPEEVNDTLGGFRQMGIRTAIDDFGVGHTGLDYLDRISVDTLKIDRSFINRIGESGAPLVTAVISLAKGLDLDVIAEGVETRAQVNFLRSHGCRYMQGYLFSKPLEANQLRRVLRNQLERRQRAA